VSAALLLPLALAWPAALLVLWVFAPFRRIAAPVTATMALPALGLAFSPETALELRAPGLFTNMALGLDTVGRPFLLLTALLWSIIPAHALAYMRHDARRASFTGFLLATCIGNIGLTIAQDVLSFYLFFALMTFAAYGLIVHTRTATALRAGRVYIIMAVAGEGLLLAGLFAIAALATDATFARVPEAYAALDRPAVVAGALLLGFGVKAGILPLHLWLPLAHPVAPTPASALLSGAMIKAGVLGWLRFLPVGDMAFPVHGAALLGAGIAATLYAALVGMTQTDAKTVLAYSSISQMGFLTTGVGGALLIPGAAPLLTLAIAVYALHHALAKAALFLAVGFGPVRFSPSSWRLAAFVLPALVLAGAPLTSGAVAKVALKGALGDLPEPWSARVDLLLALAAIGTTLLMARYLTTLAATPPPAAGRRPDGRPHLGLLAPWLLLVVLSALAGVWLPWVLAPAGELPLATDPGYVAAAVWPIALGITLAVATTLLLRRYPALTVGSVPAGDMIALIERVSAAARRAAAPLQAGSLALRWPPLAARAARAGRRSIDRVARSTESVSTGPGLGVVLGLLALLLFIALR
jgi:formate hydrogenlyase subunit 3/multisubunit Na+/H+ antiporter MnhD subunit